MRKNRNRLGLFFAFAALLLLVGCAGEVGVRRVGAAERLTYMAAPVTEGLSPATQNLLANFLLLDAYEDDPPALIDRLQEIFRNEPRPEYLAALADAALNIGIRYSSKPDRAIGYYLAAALYSYGYLYAIDRPGEEPYNPDRIVMIRIYDIALGEIYTYLKDRKLVDSYGYTLTAVGGQKIHFEKPRFELPLPEKAFASFELCADFRTNNMTHSSRSFGIGAPLIAELTDDARENGIMRYAENEALPVTLMLRFLPREREKLIDTSARFCFVDVRNQQTFRVGANQIPLAEDFSTPLAYMVSKPLPFNYISYMLKPDQTRQMQGLYLFEPYSPKRIPVVFVHGLMSNSRTWIQMINTLNSDPDLRKNYQFWGFSYSSGNPVLYSAKLLRDELQAEYNRLKAAGNDMVMFDRMVLIGHSMGGLLAKTTIMDTGDQLLDGLFGGRQAEVLAKLTPEQRTFVTDMTEFKPLPFVQRVIFISVPHRGSTLANSLVGKLGASLVELPKNLLDSGEGILGTMIREGYLLPDDSRLLTGIDNLDPKDRTLQLLDRIPFEKGVPFNSIIGNEKRAGAPGGSDGIVPYASSHLDGAESELVVHATHSAHQNPLAIQEIRRILLLNLQRYPGLGVTRPFIPDALHNASQSESSSDGH